MTILLQNLYWNLKSELKFTIHNICFYDYYQIRMVTYMKGHRIILCPVVFVCVFFVCLFFTKAQENRIW